MAELKLKSSRFRAEREADWARLEQLLSRAETRSARALSDDELIAMPVLYRSALSSLSVARATSLDQNLIDYLEGLSARAYFFVYGTRATLWERLARFFAVDWPAAAKSSWRESLICFALMWMGVALAYVLVQHDPAWFNSFVPGGLAQGRGPEASTAALRSTLFDVPKDASLTFLASFLFNNNAGVAFLGFALGFAFGIPTAFLQIYNGCTLGAFLAVFISHGLGYEVGGWLMIHGVTELSAVILSGAAGMRLGRALAFPGGRARMDALAAEGRQAATLMVGVLIMLACAALLEGYGRQLIKDTNLRYAVAAATGLIWAVYLYTPRSRRRAKAIDHG
jgi:uncharacterized membrane protein SpoIIM required for sporulation